jgi:hypothetical protein
LCLSSLSTGRILAITSKHGYSVFCGKCWLGQGLCKNDSSVVIFSMFQTSCRQPLLISSGRSASRLETKFEGRFTFTNLPGRRDRIVRQVAVEVSKFLQVHPPDRSHFDKPASSEGPRRSTSSPHPSEQPDFAISVPAVIELPVPARL